MATKNEMQAEIDRLTEKLERAEDGIRWMREMANSPKFRGTDPRDGQTNGRMAVEDIMAWASQTQTHIDEVDSFPWGLSLRVTDRGTFWRLAESGRTVFDLSAQENSDLMWAQTRLWRERRSA